MILVIIVIYHSNNIFPKYFSSFSIIYDQYDLTVTKMFQGSLLKNVFDNLRFDKFNTVSLENLIWTSAYLISYLFIYFPVNNYLFQVWQTDALFEWNTLSILLEVFSKMRFSVCVILYKMITLMMATFWRSLKLLKALHLIL